MSFFSTMDDIKGPDTSLNSIADSGFDQFWNTIETKTGSQIPSYIRNILNFHGFNSPMSVALLDEEDLNEIEKAVKSDTTDKTDEKTESNGCYGPFKSRKDFYFPRGYRKVLLSISEYIRQKGAENVLLTVKPKSTAFQISSKHRTVTTKGLISKNIFQKSARSMHF